MLKPSPLRSAILRSFHISADGSLIGLATTFDQQIGLSLRCDEAERAITRIGQAFEMTWDARSRRLVFPDRPPEACLLDLAAAFAEIASRPLTPRLLTQALGITNQERLRWTKDGRLPTSGRAQLRRSTRVTFATYAIEDVDALVANPSVVATWRNQDRMSSSP